jgi:hypothetical protein
LEHKCGLATHQASQFDWRKMHNSSASKTVRRIGHGL